MGRSGEVTHQGKFLYIGPGAIVASDGRTYRIDKVLNRHTVLGQDVATNEWTHLKAVQLQAVPSGEPVPPVPDLIEHKALYDIAQKRFAAIKPLLDAPVCRTAEVEEAAKRSGVGRATIYDWIRRYEDSPQLSSLIPRTRGVGKGGRKLDPRLEAVIEAAILSTHRTKQAHRASKTCLTVRAMCKTAGLVPPHDNTVRARIAALPRARTLRERGRREEARNRLEPIRGHFPGADWPMSVIQMDHTLGDVELVDDEKRLPLGRPWITVALDVCTRSLVGFYVSMERPNASISGNCVAMAMLPKADYLKGLGVDADWNAWGEIGVLHMDNAKEFRGEVLRRACKEYGIDLQLRPVKTPHYGGHIERLMGTMAGELRNIAGATFSNPAERKGYDSARESSMTFSEFESYIVTWFVKKYNNTIHSALGMTPNAAWELKAAAQLKGNPSGLVQVPAKDPERLRLDFMQFSHRTVGRHGVRMDNMTFWDDVLKLRIDEPDPKHKKAKRKFLVRQDPRDITRIWFLDPDTDLYKCIPTRDLSRPAVSLWEWRAVQRHQRELGEKMFDEEKMFATLEELRKKQEVSIAKTKAARRSHQRTKAAEKHGAAARAKQATLPMPKSTGEQGAVTTARPAVATVVPPTATFEPYDDIEF